MALSIDKTPANDLLRMGRDDLMERVRWLEDRLQDSEYKALSENVTALQARGTKFMDEVRGLKASMEWKLRPNWGDGKGIIQPKLVDLFAEVATERYRADCKHGSAEQHQDRPDGTRLTGDEQLAEHARNACESATITNVLTWRHIVEEEVAEAFAESEPVKLRTELIQAASSILKWVHAIDLRSDR